jgi:hypothetical protein
MRLLLLLLFLPMLFASCKKTEAEVGDKVEIYQLKTYQLLTGKCQVDATTAVLQDTAFVNDAAILAYSPNDHLFSLTPAAMRRVNALANFAAFAVTVDKKVVYYGFFIFSYSSSSCAQSIVMSLDFENAGNVSLQLGYPGLAQGIPVDDQRNNAKLVATLRRQGKIK